MNRTPLYAVQREQGAHFAAFDGWEKPEDYGDWLAEYQTVRRAIGLFDRSERGKLIVSGGDRLSWLQGMISNDVRPLGAGAPAVCGCILNATGHLLTDLRVIRLDDSLLLEMPRENLERVRQLLDGYIITEDVQIVDRSDLMACLSLQGPLATESWVRAHAGEVVGTIVAADHTGLGGVDLYLQAVDVPAMWIRLAAEARPAGEAAANALRIEAGIPLYGVDMDETTIPLECNLEATHINHAKGCYVGQEIIARIHSRGHTNRALTGLVLEGSALPHRGDRIFPVQGEAGREVGWTTSATHSPLLGHPIALGYVRHEYREPGTALRIAHGDGALSATVSALPFHLVRI